MADRIYEELRSGVLAHELRPGTRLSIPQLAVRFGVSRSPVREAVQHLVRDGLVTETPHRGCVVATVTAEELIPLYEVREVLEGLAARLAAHRATRADLARLHGELLSHERAVERGEIAGHVAHDLAFHALLRNAAGNAELRVALDKVQGKVTIAMLSGNHASWPAKAVAEHRVLLDALIAADPDAAEAAARTHISRVRDDIAALHADGRGDE
jgi:DNA-binding GntR family transcriptional regulator